MNAARLNTGKHDFRSGRWPWLFFLGWACNSAESEVGTPHGPLGGILEVETGSITWSGAGATDVEAGANSGGASGGAGTSGGTTVGTGGGANRGALGEPCSEDTDCSESLICYFDFNGYIIQDQCSTQCNASSECSSRFGANSFCIGAHLCVRACETNADCPDQTVCNDVGWCERGGPGSGVRRCTGSAWPCSLRSSADCGATLDCYQSGRCQGFSRSCFELTSSFRCESQDGCTWLDSSSYCTGLARQCSAYSAGGLCALQDGCRWEETCEGLAGDCSDLTVSLCSRRPGCFVAQE